MLAPQVRAGGRRIACSIGAAKASVNHLRVHIAQQDLIAQKTETCRRCGALPCTALLYDCQATRQAASDTSVLLSIT
jgi:hypothetical protein